MVVLDTDVLSELTRPMPATAVLRWARAQDPAPIFTTSVCEAELVYGVTLLPPGKRRDHLAQAIEVMLNTVLGGRVLPFNRAAACCYAALAGERRRRGCLVGLADLQVAAIAQESGAEAVAPRNVRDFAAMGLSIINPWQSHSGMSPEDA
jgi:predicted nucleic acid-binding protein